MFSIRPGVFETNSSSMDNFYDEDSYSKYSKCSQSIYIDLNFSPDATDEKCEEILDAIYEFDEDSDFVDIVSNLCVKADFIDIDTCDDTIEVKFEITVGVIIISVGYSGDRYSPPEEPEVEWDLSDAALPEGEDNTAIIKSISDKLMKLFEEKGWTEIIGINSIKASEPDESELMNNWN